MVKQIGRMQFTKEQLEDRLALNRTTEELKKVKREMESSFTVNSGPTGGIMPLESITAAGQSNDQIYYNTVSELNHFLSIVGQYAFSHERAKVYFRNKKVVSLITILKKAKMDMLAFSIMNIFKDRVKQINGNKIPTIKEKTGLFSKAIERPMKLEEIVTKFEIEVDIPPGEERPLTTIGTQSSLLHYLSATLLENEEIQDPIKKGPRKQVGLFLQAANLVDFTATDIATKQFLACLLTPEKLQPKSKQDAENLLRLSSMLKKGTKWLEDKINSPENTTAPDAKEKR